jgi:hypothetical protein
VLRPSLALTLALLLAGSPALASSAWPMGATGSLAAASSRATAAELKAAQVSVDAALKVRKQRFDAWQKAAKAKDAAAADVAAKKRAGVSGAPLEGALKKALALDEEAARARSSLLAAESDVARGGASLLKLYDALLVERRKSVEALPAQTAQRAQAASAYKDLSAQRDAVRAALLPVLTERGADVGASPALPRGVDLDARADDDVETLLEKADLARDLEARFLRQAEAVRKRIAELEEENAVAREVSGMVGRSQLFDEEDRRVVVLRSENANATGANSGGNERAAGGAPAPAPETDDGDVFEGAPDGTNNAPPPGDPGTTTNGGNDFVQAAPPAAFANTGAPPTLTRTEQSLGLAQTDAAMAGLLSSSGASVESLRALEAKLKAQATSLRDKSKKLKTEAKTRAQ